MIEPRAHMYGMMRGLLAAGVILLFLAISGVVLLAIAGAR